MPTTEILIQKVQQGDLAAREELYRRYALRVLFRVGVRMGPELRVKEQSWDLAQEALVKSLSGLEGFVYRSDGAFFAFLAEKVEQVIRDRHDFWNAQKRDLSKEVPIEELCSSGPTLPLSTKRADEGPVEALQRKEDLERLASALDRLRAKNEEYWGLIVGRDLDQKSFAEIAAQQVKSADAVKQEFYRARAALARIFQSLR